MVFCRLWACGSTVIFVAAGRFVVVVVEVAGRAENSSSSSSSSSESSINKASKSWVSICAIADWKPVAGFVVFVFHDVCGFVVVVVVGFVGGLD